MGDIGSVQRQDDGIRRQGPAEAHVLPQVVDLRQDIRAPRLHHDAGLQGLALVPHHEKDPADDRRLMVGAGRCFPCASPVSPVIPIWSVTA